MRLRQPQKKGTFRLNKKPDTRVYSGMKFREKQECDPEKAKKNKEDRDVRLQIQKIITADVFGNESILETIKKLNSNKSYAQYSEFFETWINERIARKRELDRFISNMFSKGMTKERVLKTVNGCIKWEKYGDYYTDVIENFSVEEMNRAER